jgi:hypothetical protein
VVTTHCSGADRSRQLHCSAPIRPAPHQIAHQDHPIQRPYRNQREQLAQLVGAAVHVTDEHRP